MRERHILKYPVHSDPVYVKASCGLVEGKRWRGGLRFLGIPYAEPPVGQLRFAAPVKRSKAFSTLRAVRFGPASPQRTAFPEPFARLSGWSGETGEDCLNLHVFTPGTTGKRPVLVFIHGGGFFIGAGSQYLGDELAKRGDIVVVTMNYRLGLIGFNGFSELFPGDERFSANVGLLDQRLALEWVRDNIAYFGGDPGRVTIAGESAGAASVGYHMVAERSHQLFHQAICQSGTINLFAPREKAEAVARTAFRLLAPSGDREALFTQPADAFVNVFRKLTARFPGLPTMPYFGGGELPDSDLGGFYRRAKPVPLLIGTNRDEFTLFTDLPGFSFPVGPDDMSGWLERATSPEKARAIHALYDASRAGASTLGTDILFRASAIHVAESNARAAPTFMYRLDWPAKGAFARLGATHSVDLPLLFDRFLSPFRGIYFGWLPDPGRRRLSERMREHWVSFVRTGRPCADWPAYEVGMRKTMIFDVADRVEQDPQRERRLAWDGVCGPVP
ncbi:putative carboxylesterase [Fulvimarina pelagi HTCC2506]|uniref:Carboxylic ester hydrolase n=2 Tax=Fulvimarina pelagi TaxID=217511 RepID=Q0FZH8_9HYPH|nr:carboxylesterase family protein [Fulvimarina pelagi]EAU40300.1 putative carboxylesterase [Fulvimarina pelagi HTCC2506]BAT31338.1 putative carboxylesterase [Fulvimarina pelagi]